MKPKTIRKHLRQIIDDLSADPMLYLRDPMRDFTRTRKLSFSDTVSVVLQMEGKSTANEILNFYRSANAPSASALRQQRNKILPAAFELIFREFSETCVVRFKISDSSFETVVTDLPYPPDELKALYAMRWGIETSFRSLKYTVGLSSFHSKKADHILQEIFARLTMYNFVSAVTHSVTVRHKQRKHPYQINFSAAVHICRQFFRGDIRPPDVEALIAISILPVRQGRASPRVPTSKSVVSFNYRIA